MERLSKRFVRDLHRWYNSNKRDLPWRRTTDPYKILVSEVMLQQTQVDRVIPKYEIFLESFPTVKELAKSSPALVIALWHGLGYNRRALNLHKGAKVVIERWHGVYPKTSKELQEIPGIGPYTAAAVSSFAFNYDIAVADTNVIRVLARISIGKAALKNRKAALKNHNPLVFREKIGYLAQEILIPGTSRLHNNAIMEFGALICQAKPRCGSCFASSYCRGFQDLKKGLLTESELSLLGTPKGGFGTVQSKFEGSDRQIRGKIVGILKDGKSHHPNEMLENISKHMEEPIKSQRLQKIIEKLVSDGMVIFSEGMARLP